MTRWFNRPEGRLDLSRRATGADNRFGAALHLLAGQLADACASALGVDCAAISLLDEGFAAPLGASAAEARLAARLQFDRGEGPGLDAVRDGRVLVVDGPELARQWPLFASDLAAETAFEGVISVPIAVGPRTDGVLQLFVRDASRLTSVDLARAAAISAGVAAALARELE
jgi:GAF domain